MTESRAGRLAWKALEPFGAEVKHDFREPLTAEEQAAFRGLMFDHGLLIMRGQRLSLEQQQRVAGYIGPVLSNGRGMEYVSPDDGVLGESAMTFHSDLAFAPEPFTALSLHGIDVAEGRTATQFASGARAWRRLPEGLKARIAGARARAVSVNLTGERNAPFDVPGDWISQDREVVLAHPVTGEPILYVSESHSAHIEGLDRATSDGLLDDLFGYLYAPDNVVEHRWSNGDLLLWDNLALQHGRPDVTGVWPRKLQRAAVAERGLVEQLPDFFRATA